MNNIVNKQNQNNSIKLLSAQRIYYRRAKWLQTTMLVFALLLPVVGILWGNNHTELRAWIALASIFLLLCEVLIISSVHRDWVRKAARIQEQFDTDLFELSWNQVVVGKKVDPEIIRLVTYKGITDQQYKKLENWYSVCVRSLPLHLARIVCQRTNITYDMSIRRTYSNVIGLFVLVLLFFIISWGIYEKDILPEFLLAVVVPFTPLVSFAVREYRKQLDCIESLNALKSEVDRIWSKVLENPYSMELAQDSRNLQDAIYRNRISSPLIYDWFYWVMRKLNENLARDAAETLVTQAYFSIQRINRKY